MIDGERFKATLQTTAGDVLLDLEFDSTDGNGKMVFYVWSATDTTTGRPHIAPGYYKFDPELFTPKTTN